MLPVLCNHIDTYHLMGVKLMKQTWTIVHFTVSLGQREKKQPKSNCQFCCRYMRTHVNTKVVLFPNCLALWHLSRCVWWHSVWQKLISHSDRGSIRIEMSGLNCTLYLIYIHTTLFCGHFLTSTCNNALFALWFQCADRSPAYSMRCFWVPKIQI